MGQKKMVSKIKQTIKKRKLSKKSRGQITESNIGDHREKIIKSGKKFKYPTHISTKYIQKRCLLDHYEAICQTGSLQQTDT